MLDLEKLIVPVRKVKNYLQWNLKLVLTLDYGEGKMKKINIDFI